MTVLIEVERLDYVALHTNLTGGCHAAWVEEINGLYYPRAGYHDEYAVWGTLFVGIGSTTQMDAALESKQMLRLVIERREDILTVERNALLAAIDKGFEVQS